MADVREVVSREINTRAPREVLEELQLAVNDRDIYVPIRLEADQVAVEARHPAIVHIEGP